MECVPEFNPSYMPYSDSLDLTAITTTQTRQAQVVALNACAISERKLHRQLYDPWIERARDLAEGRRTEGGVHARGSSVQTGKRDAGAEAVRQVEGLATNLKSIVFANWKLPGEGQVKAEEMRTWDVVATQSAERAGREVLRLVGESQRINPTARPGVGA